MHRQFYNCLKSSTTKMAFVDGRAGTMKTYIAVYAALEMIYDSLYDKLIYIRSVAESAEKSLGSLPGEVDDKFLPYAMPLLEKVQEITNNSTSNMLRQRGVIEAIPVNFVRGLTFNKSIVIVDEAHKFRNDTSNMYEKLQTITKTDRRIPGSNGDTRKKVMLLSATPLNNHPADIENQIYLYLHHDHS
mgnify:CR=1 FL=1